MYDIRFKTPFTCIVAGASGSGKTYLVNEILKHKKVLFTQPPERTFLFYAAHQEIYDDMLKTGAVDEIHQGIPALSELLDMLRPYKKSGSCCIFDDAIHDIKNVLAQMFTTYSHHYNSSIFFLTQNLFVQNNEYRTMSLNATYCILMGGLRSEGQVASYAKQISLYRPNYIVEAFRAATRNKPYSYMMFDYKQGSNDQLRIRTDILPHQFPVTVYWDRRTD